MTRIDVIKDFCIVNNLSQINKSWVQTAGDFLNILQLPGNDNYEQTVFVSVINDNGSGNESRIESPDTFTYVDCANDEINIESTGSITIGSQGDLIYTGNNAVSFNSLGSIIFTSEGGIVFSDTTTNFMQIVMSLPTVEIGLATGQLYTQTATELGGAGTQKVLCIK